MASTIHDLLQLIGVPIIVVGLIYLGSIKLNSFLSWGRKRKLARVILNVKPVSAQDWSQTYCEFLDYVFFTNNEHHKEFSIYQLRIKPALVSSATMLIILFLLFVGFLGGRVLVDLESPGIPSLLVYNNKAERHDIVSLSSLLLAPLLINFIVDYLSLMQTRYIIGLSARSVAERRLYASYPLPFLLITDFLLTCVLAFLCLPISAVVIHWIDSNLIQNVFQLKGNAQSGGLFPVGDIPICLPSLASSYWFGSGRDGLAGVFLYSTFLTSIWLWLFIAGSYLVAASTAAISVFRWARARLTLRMYINKNPIIFLGYVCNFAIVFGSAMFSFLRFLTS